MVEPEVRGSESGVPIEREIAWESDGVAAQRVRGSEVVVVLFGEDDDAVGVEDDNIAAAVDLDDGSSVTGVGYSITRNGDDLVFAADSGAEITISDDEAAELADSL